MKLSPRDSTTLKKYSREPPCSPVSTSSLPWSSEETSSVQEEEHGQSSSGTVSSTPPLLICCWHHLPNMKSSPPGEREYTWENTSTPCTTSRPQSKWPKTERTETASHERSDPATPFCRGSISDTFENHEFEGTCSSRQVLEIWLTNS